jgi:hypothetical protein
MNLGTKKRAVLISDGPFLLSVAPVQRVNEEIAVAASSRTSNTV